MCVPDCANSCLHLQKVMGHCYNAKWNNEVVFHLERFISFCIGLAVDFCQSKMLQIHIKSHLPLWYHYTSFNIWSLTNNRKFKKK